MVVQRRQRKDYKVQGKYDLKKTGPVIITKKNKNNDTLFFAERSDVENRLSKGEDEDLRQRASSSFCAFSPKMIHHCDVESR